MERIGNVKRETKETKIDVMVRLDGKGQYNIKTGVGFFDHMLELFAKHSMMDLDVLVDGDLHIDCHHTVEDTGIAMGQAFKQAIGDKKSIRRYAWVQLPMDEALVSVSLDVSGRPYFVYNAQMDKIKTGDMDVEAVEEFLQAFVTHSGITLHVNVLYGNNHHHMIEGIFKAMARAIKEAVSIDERESGIPSTKGIL